MKTISPEFDSLIFCLPCINIPMTNYILMIVRTESRERRNILTMIFSAASRHLKGRETVSNHYVGFIVRQNIHIHFDRAKLYSANDGVKATRTEREQFNTRYRIKTKS